MGDTQGSQTISTKLQRIAKQAASNSELVFNNLYHLLDYDFLLEAYRRTRKDGAPGVDKVTAKKYAENLRANLRDLHVDCEHIATKPRLLNVYGSIKKEERSGR